MDSFHYFSYFCKTGVCLTLCFEQKTMVVVTSSLCLNITEVHFVMHLGHKIPGSYIACTWYPAMLFRETLGSTNLLPSGLPFLGYSPRHYPIQLSGRVLKDPLQRQDQHKY